MFFPSFIPCLHEFIRNFILWSLANQMFNTTKTEEKFQVAVLRDLLDF